MSGLADLRGRVAVITGGASGIGRGIAERMLAHGMKVVIADIEEKSLTRTTQELGVFGVRTDVTDFASVATLAAATLKQFGKVDVVCNNAGIGPIARIADLTLDDWRWMINVNLWGVIHGVQAFLPILKANADGGHIVNTSSMSGLRTVPNLGAYAVTKFGVVALSEALARELAAENSRVGVSVLCPGPVRSDIGRSSRNRPKDLSEGHLTDVDIEKTPLDSSVPTPRFVDASVAGDVVVEAIKRGELYAFTHPELVASANARHAAIAQSGLEQGARQRA
jgi:NAD(P)-dependent dehydrogenase (short-subunit alcohol dehydrogenase family)